jgi:hypothetical protein
MNQEVGRLLKQGFHEDNLLKLAALCRHLFSKAPALYGTLTYIFETLAEEYDHQGITVNRHELIMATMERPILLLLEDEKDAAIFVERLNEVFRSFESLKG